MAKKLPKHLQEQLDRLPNWTAKEVREIVKRLTPEQRQMLDRQIEILRRGAEDHHKREIRTPELYDALTFLDQFLERKNCLMRRA